MKHFPWFLLLVLSGCAKSETPKPSAVPMVDELPVAHAELRALFEHLNEVSGNGYQCDHRLTLTRRFLAERKLPEEETLRWLGANGAGCDCEVILNVAARWGDRVGYVPKE